MSPHDPKIIYAAGNKVFRSSNRGLNWETVGADLTSNANREEIVTMGVKGSDIRISKDDGIQAWPTIISFAESAKRTGVIYAGTDDGIVQVTRGRRPVVVERHREDPGLPKGIWVSEVVPSRFDEATVYATFDGHRLNDFETYIYVSRDFGQTWQSAAANLKGEVARTLTEDQKNQDVLYLGTETGLFVSIDRAKSWVRIKANLPTVRIDEITLHPRDNAMILATHGRALWILDHLEPIQEYAAAQAAASDAKLFTPPPYAMFRRPARDRNYEFWGDQTFYGENPPQAAVISWFNRKEVGEVRLKITDAAGREIRDLAGEPFKNSNKAGIQAACWDLRVQPNPAPPPAPGARGATPSTEQGRGTTGAAPAAGGAPSQEQSPFGAGCPAPVGQGGGGGFGGGGVNVAGPYVIGGVYNVALVVDGQDGRHQAAARERRPRRRPDLGRAEAHVRHGDGDPRAAAAGDRCLDGARCPDAPDGGAHEVDGRPQRHSRRRESLIRGIQQGTGSARAKADHAAGPRRAGGGRGGATESLPAKVGQAKTGLFAGMSPADPTVRAYTEVKAQTPKAIADLNAVIAKATTLAGTLAKYNLTLRAGGGASPCAAAKKH
jgi:hypothetical protein